METLCGTIYSKSMVSEVCKELNQSVNEFRNRSLTKPYPDVTYLKFRENHRIVSNHIEPINRDITRRSDVIGVFPNNESIMRLMGSVLIDLHAMPLTQKKA